MNRAMQLKELRNKLIQKKSNLREIEDRLKNTSSMSSDFKELIDLRNNSLAFVYSVSRQIDILCVTKSKNRLGVLDSVSDPKP